MKINLKEYVLLLKKYLVKQKIPLILLFITLFLNIGVEVVRPSILGRFIDNVRGDAPMNKLYMFGIIYFILTILRQGFIILNAYLIQNIGWKATNGLRIDICKHALNLDMAFHKKFTPGQLVERVDGDIASLFGFFTTFITDIVKNLLMMLFVIVFMATISIKFALLHLVFLVAVYLYFVVMSKKIDETSEALREEESNLYGLIGEHITSVEDLRALNGINYALNKEKRVLNKLSVAYIKDWIYGWGSWSYDEICFAIFQLLTFIILGKAVLIDGISLGTAYTLFDLSNIVMEPIFALREQLLYMQKTDASIRRIKELQGEVRHVSEGSINVSKEGSNISLNDVYFSYEDDEPVINGVNFKIEDGKILGLLGRTGSGKTTLARLIVKLYDVTKGEILLNGINIKDISDSSLRRKISYVTQEVQLFNGSVRDNLTLYDKTIGDETIINIIEEIGIKEWFLKLPEGLDTKISTEKPFLSQGELQLLTFLRVFLNDPDIVILDEATSKLDPITEMYLEKALNNLLKNRTVIIIAHKLKTILRADDILILDDGKVLEQGNLNNLRNNPNSKFKKLLEKGLEEVLV